MKCSGGLLTILIIAVTHLLIWHNLLDIEISRLSPQGLEVFSSFHKNNLIELYLFQQHALSLLKN